MLVQAAINDISMHPEAPGSKDVFFSEQFHNSPDIPTDGLENISSSAQDDVHQASLGDAKLFEAKLPDERLVLYDNLMSQMSLDLYAFLRQDYGIYSPSLEAARSRYDALTADEKSFKRDGRNAEQTGYLVRLLSYIRVLSHIEAYRLQLRGLASKATVGLPSATEKLEKAILDLRDQMSLGTYFNIDRATRTLEDELWE